MNDFEYDVLQKKRLARSAQKKRNGSRSRKCSLPSDFMTDAQIRNMAKERFTVNLGKPMKYDEFKKLPVDIQQEYLQTLVDRYDCSMNQIADMFGVSNGSVIYRHMKRNGISVHSFHQGKRRKDQIDAWMKFVLQTDKPVKLMDCPFVREGSLSHFELSWDGSVSIEEVMNCITNLSGGKTIAKISVSVELGGD